MKYLENTIKFCIKFFMLLLPLYVLAAVPSLISGANAAGSSAKYMQILTKMGSDPTNLQNPAQLVPLLTGFATAVVGAGILTMLLNLAVTPASYGMINKALGSDYADLNDFVPALKDNFVKYILYLLGGAVLWLVFGIAVAILFVVIGLITAILKPLGAILMVLAVIGLIVAGVVIGVLTSLWFPAMIVDNLDVVAALKKSISVARGAFWTILGITVLIWVASAIAGAILSIFGLIPLIGSLVVSIVPAATSFVTMVFVMMVYRERA